jgi:hypothetical protein
MVFSTHHTAEDARWVMQQMQNFLVGIEKSQPITFWLENVSPVGMPEDVHKLQELFNRNIPEPVDLVRGLASEPVPHRLKGYLQRVFGRLQAISPSAEAYLSRVSDQDIFGCGIRNGIVALKKEGWNIQPEFENNNFGSYLSICVTMPGHQ